MSIIFAIRQVTREDYKGAARALITEVYEQARLVGSPHVYWQTYETNFTAMALYDKVAEKSGFVVYRKIFELLVFDTTLQPKIFRILQ